MRAAKLPGTGGAAFGLIIERYERMLQSHGQDIEVAPVQIIIKDGPDIIVERRPNSFESCIGCVVGVAIALVILFFLLVA